MEKTIAHRILDIESEVFDVPKVCYERLDGIITAADRNIGKKIGPISIFKALDKTFDKFMIWGKRHNLNLISEMLLMKETNCKKKIVYHGIGQVLGHPIKLVAVPSHLFARWDDGVSKVNWESSLFPCGKEVNDSDYIFGFNIPEGSVNKGICMKSLSHDEVLAFAYYNMACELYKQDRFKKAKYYFNKSKERYLFASTYSGIAATDFQMKDYESALKNCNKAIELDSNLGEAYHKRSGIYEALSNMAAAKKDHEHSVKLKTELSRRFEIIKNTCNKRRKNKQPALGRISF